MSHQGSRGSRDLTSLAAGASKGGKEVAHSVGSLIQVLATQEAEADQKEKADWNSKEDEEHPLRGIHDCGRTWWQGLTVAPGQPAPHVERREGVLLLQH